MMDKDLQKSLKKAAKKVIKQAEKKGEIDRGVLTMKEAKFRMAALLKISIDELNENKPFVKQLIMDTIESLTTGKETPSSPPPPSTPKKSSKPPTPASPAASTPKRKRRALSDEDLPSPQKSKKSKSVHQRIESSEDEVDVKPQAGRKAKAKVAVSDVEMSPVKVKKEKLKVESGVKSPKEEKKEKMGKLKVESVQESPKKVKKEKKEKKERKIEVLELSDQEGSPVKPKLKPPKPSKSKPIILSSPPPSPTTKPPPEADADKSESEMSSLIDDGPVVGKGKKRGKAAPKEPGAGKKAAGKVKAASADGEDPEVKRLKALVTACGVRKMWKKEFADKEKTSQQKSHVASILVSLGMSKPFSLGKARAIKEARELAAELDDVTEFDKLRGLGNEEASGRPKRKTATAVARVESDSGDESGSSSESVDSSTIED